MINQDLFRSYFLVEDKGISIYVKNNTNSKIVFFEKKKIDKDSLNFFINDIQPFFLEKIEKIESQIKLFVDNTVLIIEHNLDVIKSADWIIDMGPEGGINGGQIICEGTPEKISENKSSYTGTFLKPMLKKNYKKTA